MISDKDIPVLQLPIKKRYTMPTAKVLPSAQIYIKDYGESDNYPTERIK